MQIKHACVIFPHRLQRWSCSFFRKIYGTLHICQRGHVKTHDEDERLSIFFNYVHFLHLLQHIQLLWHNFSLSSLFCQSIHILGAATRYFSQSNQQCSSFFFFYCSQLCRNFLPLRIRSFGPLEEIDILTSHPCI